MHDDPVLSGQLLWQKTVLVDEMKSRVLTRKELREKFNTSPDRAESYIMSLHGLRICQDLPDERPVSKSDEFWQIVKQDIKKNERGHYNDGWQKIG